MSYLRIRGWVRLQAADVGRGQIALLDLSDYGFTALLVALILKEVLYAHLVGLVAHVLEARLHLHQQETRHSIQDEQHQEDAQLGHEDRGRGHLSESPRTSSIWKKR